MRSQSARARDVLFRSPRRLECPSTQPLLLERASPPGCCSARLYAIAAAGLAVVVRTARHRQHRASRFHGRGGLHGRVVVRRDRARSLAARVRDRARRSRLAGAALYRVYHFFFERRGDAVDPGARLLLRADVPRRSLAAADLWAPISNRSSARYSTGVVSIGPVDLPLRMLVPAAVSLAALGGLFGISEVHVSWAARSPRSRRIRRRCG